MALTENDYKSAADKLGVDIASVKAVASVESSGSGFFKDGRPTILFERHIFYREVQTILKKNAKTAIKLENPLVQGKDLEKMIINSEVSVANQIAVYAKANPDVCNTSTGGYVGGVKEYDRLEKAKLFCPEAALRSCSWGAFQVMGFHAELLGYSDVFEMVEAAQSDAGQLDIFVRFILKNPNILKALRNKDWTGFAKGYNGPAYAKNAYNTKLANAYKKFA